MKELMERGAGILCHISSLPGKYGIGTLGREAYEFADFLKNAHVKYWQILPLAQTGFGDSPYSSVCSYSGNPYFIDLEALKDEGLLTENELSRCEMPEGRVNYGILYRKRYDVLKRAYARFDIENEEFKTFVESGEFEDYALFMSLKSKYGETFQSFPDEYKYRDKAALEEFKASVYKTDYCFWLFLQFVFEKQWVKLKNYVNSLGIKIIGDIPLYVAYDSSDVWAHSELFCLDGELKPTEVAGVPPDYFSPTGQLWGNPVYNWEAMESNQFEWWTERMRKERGKADVIRIDHFRGFDRYYTIPADAEDATVGEWKQGPGLRFFLNIEKKLGNVQIIAEDLGEYDAGVEKLRLRTGYPGMKILLFAFDGNPKNPYLPAKIEENSIVYTGTHDNATALEFLNKMRMKDFTDFKARLREALDGEGAVIPFVSKTDAVRALCVCALATPANVVILPIQDLLGLGADARMNVPSTADGNWRFRLKETPTRYDAAIMRKYVKEFSR